MVNNALPWFGPRAFNVVMQGEAWSVRASRGCKVKRVGEMMLRERGPEEVGWWLAGTSNLGTGEAVQGCDLLQVRQVRLKSVIACSFGG